MTNVNLLYNALAEHGIEIPKQYRSSGFMRWGKNNRYWAKEVEDGYVFGDYSEGISESIFPKPERQFTTEERQKWLEAKQRAQSEAEAEQSRLWQEAADRAYEIWQELAPADIDHQYLAKKQVGVHGLRQSENKLVIPLYDNTNKIWSLQYIDEVGNKRFLYGGKKKGCYFMIGEPKDNRIVVCEGFATGASIFESTGHAAVVAFDCGNLEPVVKALKTKYPGYRIGVAADNDIKENAPNIGLNEAERISKSYNTETYIPKLKNNQEKCDFNDLMVKEGKEAVRAVFEPEIIIQENKSNIPFGYLLNDDGLFKTPVGDTPPQKISNKIEVLAEARDEKKQNWSKLVRFNDPDGNSKTLLIPNTLFATDGKELKELLLYNGLYICRPDMLKKYLNECQTPVRALCVNKTGWHGEDFIFPDNSKIGKSKEIIHFQGDESLNEYQIKGSLDDWRENIGKYCRGNSRLILAVSTAFASPLLHITGMESGGLHFVGGSSIGKSTILRVACSVYGSKKYLKSWRTTDNGLEGIAARRNDTLLALDELGQVDSNKVGEIAYMLGNDSGKTRSNRSGEAREPNRWRLLYLSSGEKDLDDCAIESKKKIKAGQTIRFLSIPAKPSDDSHGVFENLHDKKDGKELSEYLNQAVGKYFGAAARAFIEGLTNDGFSSINQNFLDFSKEMQQRYMPEDADNQVKRAFNRFMLIAFAGEYATQKCITGWDNHEAINACSKCFEAWIDCRGGIKDQESKELFKQVRYFFEQNGESRFHDLEKDVGQKTINMAGYKTKVNDEQIFLVYPESFEEICRGHNLKFAKDTLYKANWIETTKAKQMGSGELRGKRFYVFTSKIWSDENAI